MATPFCFCAAPSYKYITASDNNQSNMKYIRGRKPAREAFSLFDNKSVKGLLKEDREIVEKRAEMNEFFVIDSNLRITPSEASRLVVEFWTFPFQMKVFVFFPNATSCKIPPSHCMGTLERWFSAVFFSI